MSRRAQQPHQPAPPSSSSGAATPAGVNWAAVDRELASVPQDFKDPKFYALKHVVEILTAEDARSLVAQVCFW
jgi:hypothetical protein